MVRRPPPHRSPSRPSSDGRGRFYVERLEPRTLLSGAPPTIEALSVGARVVEPGETVLLQCWNVIDPEEDAVTVRFYRESNGVAGLQTSSGDAAPDLALGADSTGADFFLATDAPSDVAFTTRVIYYAVPDDGASSGEPLAVEVVVYAPRLAASPEISYDGDTVTLTATGLWGRAEDMDYPADRVMFYEEADGTPGLHPFQDMLLGSDRFQDNPGEEPARFTYGVAAQGLSAATRTFYALADLGSPVVTVVHSFGGYERPDRFEPNDQLATVPLMEVPPEGSIGDLSLTSGDVDYFRFITGRGPRTLQVQGYDADGVHVGEDIVLALYDAAGNVIDRAPEPDDLATNIYVVSTPVDGGEYYLEVRSARGGYVPSYNLNVRGDPPTVVGRFLAYKNSSLDGYDATPGDATYGAIAINYKWALLPGFPSGVEHVSGYDKGINAIVIEVWGLPQPAGAGGAETISAADFDFGVSANGDPGSWRPAPAPNGVGIYRDDYAGLGDPYADRIVLTWTDGAITNTWLRMTVKAGGPIGLPASDVFYYGSLPGDTGSGNRYVQKRPSVDAADLMTVRSNLGAPLDGSLRPYLSDNNRDGTVDGLDFAITRRNLGRSLAAFTAPESPGPPLQVASVPPLPGRRARASIRGDWFAEAPLIS